MSVLHKLHLGWLDLPNTMFLALYNKTIFSLMLFKLNLFKCVTSCSRFLCMAAKRLATSECHQINILTQIARVDDVKHLKPAHLGLQQSADVIGAEAVAQEYLDIADNNPLEIFTTQQYVL